MTLKHEFRRALWKVGYDVSRFTPATHPLARRRQILNSYAIDTILDIGANTGQFATQLRHDVGFAGRIVSFEPQSRVFEILKAHAKSDPNWEVYNWAVGEADGTAEINISGNPLASSLLDVLPVFVNFAPDAKYIGKESITVRAIDSFFGDLCKNSKSIYLKIDTQGFESEVLKGAEASLARINTVQMEMSLVTLYKGETLFNDMCIFMAKKGYDLISIEEVFSDGQTGQLMQVDGIFHRF